MSEGDYSPAASGGFKKATRAQKAAMAASFAKADELAKLNRAREAQEQANADGEIDSRLNSL